MFVAVIELVNDAAPIFNDAVGSSEVVRNDKGEISSQGPRYQKAEVASYVSHVIGHRYVSVQKLSMCPRHWFNEVAL